MLSLRSPAIKWKQRGRLGNEVQELEYTCHTRIQHLTAFTYSRHCQALPQSTTKVFLLGMAETTSVVDFSTLEREKENITANRDGHSALALQQTFSVPRNQRQQQLAATKAQFNREVEQALRDSDDPLEVFVRFVQWTLDSYPSGKSSDSGLTPLLELATRTFKDEPQYRLDRRYLNLWLQYANLVAKPQLIFAHLLANDIGSVFTLLYVEYANVLERLGQ